MQAFNPDKWTWAHVVAQEFYTLLQEFFTFYFWAFCSKTVEEAQKIRNSYVDAMKDVQ